MEGQDAYRFVPAGNKKEPELRRAHTLQLLAAVVTAATTATIVMQRVATTYPVPQKSFFHIPLPNSHICLSLAEPKRSKSRNIVFRLATPTSEDGVDGQVGDTGMTQHSPQL